VSDNEWVVEAAIPLAELDSLPTESRSPWAITLRRSLPSGAMQAWPQPIGRATEPRACGYLIFP
jgi:hypothetical protein